MLKQLLAIDFQLNRITNNLTSTQSMLVGTMNLNSCHLISTSITFLSTNSHMQIIGI